MIKSRYKKIIFLFLFLITLVGCTGISGMNDDSRFLDPRGTTPFVSDEERGDATLKVVETTPDSKYVGPPVNFSIRFNEAVNEESIEKYLYIGDSGNRVIRCKYFFREILDSPEIIVELMPLDSINAREEYYLNIGKNCKSRLGHKMEEDLKIPFTFSNKILTP